MTAFGKLRKSILGSLSKNIALLSQGESKAAQHLRSIVDTVVQGFHIALEDDRFEVLIPRLTSIGPELRGFAYEGATMGLLILDSLFPWKKRLLAFMAGPGSPYIYPIYVGMGLGLARAGRKPEQYLPQLDPVAGWFLIDGYGFRWALRSLTGLPVEQQPVPEHLSSYARRVFDQGLGRGIWFTNSADIERIVATIAAFPQERRAELWGGVGFACGYAGGAERADIEALLAKAGAYRPQLARGAAVAAKGHQREGDLVPHTELACEILCGLSGNEAASLTDAALQGLPMYGNEPAYKLWLQRIEAEFAAVESVHQRKEAVS